MTQAAEQGKVWLTQDAFDKLTQELRTSRGPGARRSSPGSAPPGTRAT